MLRSMENETERLNTKELICFSTKLTSEFKTNSNPGCDVMQIKYITKLK